MRWLSFIRDGESTFGYLTGAGDGVVDAGARSDFGDLKSAIAADALTELASSCGDDADLALAGLSYLPTITNPDKIFAIGLN